MLRTPLCRLLDIEVPVFAAPMGFVTGPELAAAVSNAGGLGIMSFSGNPPAVLREEIRRLRSLTGKPFGIGVLLSGPHLPFPVEAAIDVCIEEQVPVLLTFWGDPTAVARRAKAAGVKVIDQVGSVADAERAVRAGVDAVVAQGVEAGGHVAGEVTTLALVPRVVDAVAPVPVIAAGGIADARGFVAALALGAQGVMIGTRLIATPEAYAHPIYKQKIIDTTEDQTVRTTLFGHGWPNAPHRTLRTPFVEHWLPEETRGSEQRPDEPQIGETRIGGQLVPLLRFMGFPPTPATSGDLECMDFLAGQGVGLVQTIKPAADVVQELVNGARQIISQLAERD
ncbi:NAD(P)H-dependent flavin oxidoreductase [Bradyrhizobium australiense]|uniref:Nitronate monooxygenase n=1 Tax=Bradyrhizobium australiense TaxID=2721161 RepID=A0A7Y4GWA4_9BRAD|nr:nitronate monooxygenase [Bradyrhizobium australiense]NOJ43046.1 nitronate monooxygenase [Bradyrhizobium australiense]